MIEPQEIALRLLIAAMLGGVIGLNRGQLAWTAGLRTHMLVAVGSALAIIAGATLGTLEATIRQHRLPLFKMVVRRQERAADTVTTQFADPVHRDQLVALADAIRHVEGVQSVALGPEAK